MSERETVRCGRCELKQFLTEKRVCRRCGVGLGREQAIGNREQEEGKVQGARLKAQGGERALPGLGDGPGAPGPDSRTWVVEGARKSREKVSSLMERNLDRKDQVRTDTNLRKQVRPVRTRRPNIRNAAEPVRGGVAERLVQMRRLRNHSQESLSTAAGCHRTHIGKIESRRCSPTLETLERLAVTLEMPMSLFLASDVEFTTFVEAESRRKVEVA